MSPPPRHEAEDYLSSQALHGGKKKHHARGPISPLAVSSGSSRPFVMERTNQSPFLGGNPPINKLHTSDTTRIPQKAPSTARLQPQEHPLLPSQILGSQLAGREYPQEDGQPSAIAPVTTTESLAVISLRRMSEAIEETPASASSKSNKSPRTVREALEALFSTSNEESQSQKQSVDDLEPSVTRRRRSAAFRDGDRRRRPNKNEGPAVVTGLEIPATITLRKATGLFHSVPTPLTNTPTMVQVATVAQDEPVSLPVTHTLIKFDSQVLKDSRSSTGHQDDNRIRKPSGAMVEGHELQSCTPVLNGSGIIESRRSSLVEPAVTISSILPSPALLVLPTKVSAPDRDHERRVSVVQIVSRKSLHQVIWYEGDTSSSSASSDDPISPTGSESSRIKAGEMNPCDLSQGSVSKNEASPFVGSSMTSETQIQMPLLENAVTEEADNHQPKLKARPEGQILRWSWGTPAGTSGDSPVPTEGEAKELAGTSDTRGWHDIPISVASTQSIPRLFVPDGDDDQSTSHDLGLARRGSFVANGSLYLSMDFGREHGSRRSISVHPLSLPEGGNEGVPLLNSGGYVSRRASYVE
ncbi:MAG: hypothetical protein Q9220_001089 [cf. Caloplaca sp. 1 TL-2023]